MKSVPVLLVLLFCTYLFQGCGKTDQTYMLTPATEQNNTYKIDGKISLRDIPLKNILVQVDSLTCFTDSTGYYKFDSLKNGLHTLVVKDFFYQQIDTVINLTENTPLWFQLIYRCHPFFPLVNGNYWEYVQSDPALPLKITVLSDTLINGKTYFKLLWQNPADSIRYMRISNDTLYERLNDSDEILAPFRTSPGQIFIYKTTNPYFTRYRGELLPESNDSLLIFSYTPIEGSQNLQFYMTFQKGIGISKYQRSIEIYNLWDYHLN